MNEFTAGRCRDVLAALTSRAISRAFSESLTSVSRRHSAREFASVAAFRSAVQEALTCDGVLAPIAGELRAVFTRESRSLTDHALRDWLADLALLCDEFGDEVRAISRATVGPARRSPSLIAMTPSPSELDEDVLKWEDIASLGREITAMRTARGKERLFQCLKAMEPRAAGEKAAVVDLTRLAQSALAALRDELALMRSVEEEEDDL